MEELNKNDSSFTFFDEFCGKYVTAKHEFYKSQPLNLYPYQQDLGEALSEEEKLLVHKFRFGGFTTTVLAWSLWKCLVTPKYKIIYVPRKQRDCWSGFDSCLEWLRNIPDWWVKSTYNDGFLFDNGSSFSFANIKLAQGKICTHLIIDEVSRLIDPINYDRLLSLCERCTIIGSGWVYDETDWYQGMYDKARKGFGDFKIFHADCRESPFYSVSCIHDLIELNGYKSFLTETGFFIPE